MSYLVVWGYKTGLTNKKFLGIKPCGNCGKFSERYLAKSFFRINLFWFLPIFGVPTGKYVRCANCDGVRKLTRAEWNELKEAARFMPKKKDYLAAYEELKGLVVSADTEDLNTSTIYNRLLGKLSFSDDGGHIRELVDVYLQNSQNVVSRIAPAEAPADAEGETPALVTENGITREIDQATAPAQEIPSTVPASADIIPSSTTTPAAPQKRSKLRLLWLIPALLMLPVALIFLIATFSLFGDPTIDFLSMIISALLFIGIPVGLDVLFFYLALKKNKN